MIGIQTRHYPGNDLVLGVDECRRRQIGANRWLSMILGTTCSMSTVHRTAEIRMNPTGRDLPQRARPTAVACFVAAHEVMSAPCWPR